MAVVLGPAADPAVLTRATALLEAGETVILWDPDGDTLAAVVPRLPLGPGRLATWTGSGADAGLEALRLEMLDRPVK